MKDNKEKVNLNKTQQVLEEKAALLQLITDNMFDLVALTDPQGHFTFLGKSHEILGYDLEYLKGKNVMDFVHPDDYESVMETFMAFVQNREDVRRVEYRIRCQDNSYLWLETMGKVLTDHQGQIRELLFSSLDITHQKREKEKLKRVIQSTQVFLETTEGEDPKKMAEDMASLTGAAYVVFNLSDPEGLDFTTLAIAGASDHLMKAAHIMGFNPIGKKWAYDSNRHAKMQQTAFATFEGVEALVAKDFPAWLIPLLKKNFNTGQVAVFNILKKEKLMGNFTLIMPRGIQLENTELATLYATQVGMYLEREEYIQQLRQERDLFAAGPVLTITWNAAKRGSILKISPNVTDILGYTAEEITSPGFIYDDIIHPGDREKQRGDSNSYQEKGLNRYSQHYRLKTKTGAYRWFYDQTQCIRDNAGEIIGYVGYLMDQTPLMVSQQELEEERRRLADIIEATHMGTWEWNVETGQVLANQRWAEMIGYTLEELEPITINTWAKFVHPEDMKASQDQLQKVYSGSRVYYDIECRMKHKEGHWVWVQDRGKVISWTEDRKPLWMSGTHADITQRKAAEKELADSKNLLDSIFHSIQDGMSVLDANLTIKETNHALKKLYGVKGSIVGKKCYEVAHNRSKPCEVCSALQALEQKKACSALVPLNVKGQAKGWLEIFSYPLFDQSTGEIEGVVEFVRDITERRKLEEKLQLQSMVLDQIQDRVNITDLDGIITYANRAEWQALGYSKNELVGLLIQKLKDEPGRGASPQEVMAETLRQGAWRGEIINKAKDGQKTIVDLRTQVVFDEQGNRVALAGISTDITERKEAEEALKLARQQAERANEAKNRYLAHMNHEMRTPLNGFMGFIDLMETTGLDDEQQEFMYHMKQSAGHLLSIVNNVLDHAKIEAGEMKIKHKPFLLKEEVQTALSTLRALARQQNLDLLLTLDQDLPVKVVGDAQRLRQIILNLVGNAIKFTPKGQVHLTLACLETIENHHLLQLVVEDTGIGMAEESMAKLFQPFYQGDDGPTLQSKGTGLGLIITKELVELMGGQIQLKSTLGKGTRVEVSLMLMKG